MSTAITGDWAKKVVTEGLKKVRIEDVDKVLKEKDKLEKKFSPHGPLARFIEDFRLLFSVLCDYANGEYRSIPWYSLGAIVVALVYTLSPFDLIPDFIPVIGLSDDAAVMAACLLLVEQDLHEYKVWKLSDTKS